MRPTTYAMLTDSCMYAGDETMIGKIATLATDTSTHRSTLQVEVHRLVWFVGILAFSIAIILFAIGLARKMSPLPAFVNGFILVVVANVPEVSNTPGALPHITVSPGISYSLVYQCPAPVCSFVFVQCMQKR